MPQTYTVVPHGAPCWEGVFPHGHFPNEPATHGGIAICTPWILSALEHKTLCGIDKHLLVKVFESAIFFYIISSTTGNRNIQFTKL